MGDSTNYLRTHFNAIQQDEVNNTSCENMQQLVVRAKQNLEMVKNAQQEGDTRYKTLARHDADRGILWVNAKVEKCKNTLNTLVIAKHSKYDPLSTYIKQRAYPNQPPLTFEKVAFNTDPFMSLRKHYNRANPNFTNQLAFPCTKGSLIMFNSYLYHGFGKNNTDHKRVSLAFNILANLSDRDHYKLKFEKEERFFNNETAEYEVQGTNSDSTIARKMSK